MRVFVYLVAFFFVNEYLHGQNSGYFHPVLAGKIMRMPHTDIPGFVSKLGLIYKDEGKEGKLPYAPMLNEGELLIRHVDFNTIPLIEIRLLLNGGNVMAFIDELKAAGFNYIYETRWSEVVDTTNSKFISIWNIKEYLACFIEKDYTDGNKYRATFRVLDYLRSCVLVTPVGTDPTFTKERIDSFNRIKDPVFIKNDKEVVVYGPSRFKGGGWGLSTYMNSNVQYPRRAIEKGAEGFLTIKYTITRKGLVRNVVVVKGQEIGYGLPKEAIRLIKSMPKWQPLINFDEPRKSKNKSTIAFKVKLPCRYNCDGPY